MKTKIITTILALVFTNSIFAVEQSSEIPAKREFPLSKSVNPCDDFHKYVCSEAESHFKLREDRSRHTFAFNDSSERILETKKKFFINIDKEKKLSPREEQVRDYYMACMNEKAGAKQEKKAIADIEKDLAEVKSISDLKKMMVNRLFEGKSSFYQFGDDANKDNPNVYDVILMTQFMNLPEHSYYDNKDLMKDYRKLVVDFFKIADPKSNSKDIEKRAENMIEFEKKFVKVYPHPEVLRQRWSEKRQETQPEFLKKYADLNFDKILEKTPKNLFVSNPIPEALDFLKENMTEKNLAVLKDFYLYSNGSGILDDSNPKYFKEGFEFDKKYLGGPNVRSVRQERCTRSAMRSFGLELDQILLPRMFPNFPSEKVEAVASKIKESIIDGLKHNTWLSDESKKMAVVKIQSAKLFIIQPKNDKEWDFKPIKKYSSTNKIENAYLLRKTLLEKDMADLKEPVNHESWGMGPLTVNAYYDPTANKFVMPIGILQFPFFVAEGDIIENLGAVGAVLAHELGHSIDDNGSKYDETGRLKPWMSIKELGQFSTRGKRLIDQFNKAGHNGALTIGENIADLVGVTFAYNAAFPEGKGSIEDKQKFFIAYARLWCNVTRPKAEEAQLKTDPHALGWARINEQVKHQAGFAEAFACKQGSPMSLPEAERIKIW
jgi:putative endopeptidase